MNNCLNCVFCDKSKAVAPGEAWCHMIDDAVAIHCCGKHHAMTNGDRIRTMTNGDRIRQMSNEEIVMFLSESSESICPFSCPPEHAECSDDCRQCWLNWLNAEYVGK